MGDSGHGERKTEIKTRLNEVPLSIATKIVGSSLREWGKTVNHTSSSTINLSRKYKIGGDWYHILINKYLLISLDY